MHVLFVGDVVGPRAVEWLAARLPALRAEHRVDLTIVDAENAGPDGASMTVDAVERLLRAGADVVTGGNHAFDGPEFERVLAHDRVLRPLNVADTVPGKGTLTVTAATGEAVRVVVLADRQALEPAPPFARMTREPYAAFAALPNSAPLTIVEMHAQSVAEKQTLAHALDGEVAAVLGTHTHEPTLELRVLPRGTALVSDVGMTGPSDGLQGLHPQPFIDQARGVPPIERAPVRPADGETVLAAILLEVEGGVTRRLGRLVEHEAATP
jgi:2',3'-cyclic-nucleotide 2'-phosphodiesterase